jgi:hypothetical protein
MYLRGRSGTTVISRPNIATACVDLWLYIIRVTLIFTYMTLMMVGYIPSVAMTLDQPISTRANCDHPCGLVSLRREGRAISPVCIYLFPIF